MDCFSTDSLIHLLASTLFPCFKIINWNSRARREASLLRAQDPFVAPTLPRTVVNEYHSMRRLVVLRALRPFLLPPDQRILSSFVPGTPAWVRWALALDGRLCCIATG